MNPSLIAPIAFITGVCFIGLIAMLVSGRKSVLEERLEDLSGRDNGPSEREKVTKIARAALPRMGSALVPTDEEERSKLQTRLIHAGLYGRQAMAAFFGVKLVLMIGPAILGLALGFVGPFTPQTGAIIGACLGIVGVIGPSFWLDGMKAGRQSRFRRTLPDALDMIVVCLEGGLSLQNSLRRVGEELETAYPELALELTIVQRETQLGRTPGDAIRQMGQRVDLEELRSLASVIIQADRFGASLAKALRVHSETLREKRQLRAEELAQKAATKLLFPTILFIFPVVFVVTLGPAVIHLLRIFSGLPIGPR